MAKEYASIQVKKQRGGFVVSGMGQTPRGTKYIRAKLPIKAKSILDPNFKKEVSQAVLDLFDESE